MFCTALAAGTHFLLRTCVDRLAVDGRTTVCCEMAVKRCKGLHRIELPAQRGGAPAATAQLELRYARLRLLPPIGKQARYPALDLTVLHATERGTPPAGRAPIEWKLVTDLPVRSRADAVRMLEWYAMRWRIETFHKILKSGCHAEDSKLRTATRLTNFLAILCVVSCRIFWLTMINRAAPGAPATLAFMPSEIALLGRLRANATASTSGAPALAACITQLACLGGYLARSRDPPPGNLVIWRGMTRLLDIELGYTLGVRNLGK